MKRYFAAGTAILAIGAAVFYSCSGDDTVEPDNISFRGADPSMSGAIFTTLPDGSSVNANIYDDKDDVYLDGGPGPHAPATAAGLPEGDYYFQVTDPSGKDLLSEDHISCRRIHVDASGLIDQVYSGTNYEWSHGSWNPVSCQHLQGVDLDHGADGAITVQLMPYENTPNQGGVYKAWLTRVEDYSGDAAFVPTHRNDEVNGELWAAGNFHGFVPARSKTDNYKVKKGKPYTPPLLTIRKFHDANLNAVQDTGEESIEGWAVTVFDPVGTDNTYYTTATVTTTEGLWGVVEDQPAGSMITASFLDGASLSQYPAADPAVGVDVAGDSGETHEVVFGNVGVGAIDVCKVFDRNGDGVADADEPPVPGWTFSLSGTDVTGATVGPRQATAGAEGCASFDALLPGEYTVTEIMPGFGTWVATGPTEQSVTIASNLIGATVLGTVADLAFTNVCTASAGFGTKGYWHNKNGLSEMTDDDIAYVNTLLPYAQPSSYFDDGDEPFDGTFTNGDPVAASLGSVGEEIAPPGTAKAEVSQFLVDANATGDEREQLAQQLLAFIFNSRHRLDDPAAAVQLPDGTFTSAAGLITEAIDAWESGTAEARIEIKDVLEGFNQSADVVYIPAEPCSAVPA